MIRIYYNRIVETVHAYTSTEYFPVQCTINRREVVRWFIALTGFWDLTRVLSLALRIIIYGTMGKYCVMIIYSPRIKIKQDNLRVQRNTLTHSRFYPRVPQLRTPTRIIIMKYYHLYIFVRTLNIPAVIVWRRNIFNNFINAIWT